MPKGRGPDIAPYRKGGKNLSKSSYLTTNLYSTWWMSGSRLMEEQVMATTMNIARNKINRKFHVPKSSIGVRLIMRKGAYRGTGLRVLK